MNLYTRPFKAMGSPCELKLYARSEAQADSALQLARNEIEKLEARYSRYRPDSLLSRINAAAGTGNAIEVDDETAGLLDYAAQAYEQSDGLFDITSGVLRRAWDFKSQRLPSQQAVAALLPLVGWDKVTWKNRRISLPIAGMELDFGGYVKEYAADVAASACIAGGIAHGLVELGGDVRLIGPHPDGSAWRVGIRHPRAPEQALAYVDMHEGAIASSGDYERAMVINGVRYCHILDPKTGWPVRALSAVSVLAPQCLVAGTVSTSAMLRQGAGPAWLREVGLPHLVVDANGEISGDLACIPVQTKTQDAFLAERVR